MRSSALPDVVGVAALSTILLAGCTGMGRTGPAAEVDGSPDSMKTNVLEAVQTRYRPMRRRINSIFIWSGSTR